MRERASAREGAIPSHRHFSHARETLRAGTSVAPYKHDDDDDNVHIALLAMCMSSYEGDVHNDV